MLKYGSLKKYDYIGACTFYLFAIVVTLVCQALAGVVSSLLSNTIPDIENNGNFNTAFMIVVQLANMGFIALYCGLKKNRPSCDLVRSSATGKFDFRDLLLPIVAASVLLAGMYLPTVWYGYFTTYALKIPPDAGNVDLSSTASVVMIVTASVFLAPVAEETIYRGVLLNGMKEEKTVVRSVMLSALAFMLMHMNPVQVVFQFSLGVLSAFVMHKTGRLLPCVVLHASANALALVMQMTSFANVLYGCESWLTQNIAAAVFITLGLFVGAGALLFAIVKFAFGSADKTPDTDADAADKITAETVVRMEARRKDGTFRFYAGIMICAVLFIINTVVLAVGS